MKQQENSKMPERIHRETVYESDYVCLYVDQVRLPSGTIVEKYHQIHYPHDAVCIVVFNDKDEILLIQNKRYTLGKLEWEIPSGKVEPKESAEDAARRECLEETGCCVKDIHFLCTQNPANGMSDCVVHCFAAKVDEEQMQFDTDEVAAKKWFSQEEVLQMLKHNETKDGVAILAILYALQFYER